MNTAFGTSSLGQKRSWSRCDAIASFRFQHPRRGLVHANRLLPWKPIVPLHFEFDFMSDLFTTYADLAAEIDIQKDGTISKTLYQGDSLKVVLFGFDAGQELSEHTAAVPAMLQFLDGDATVTLGDKTIDAAANTFVHMAAKLPHSISANKPTRMLLLLLKGAKPNG